MTDQQVPKEIITVLNLMSETHGKMWDTLEKILHTYKDGLDYRIERLDSGWYFAILKLYGHEVVQLRKRSTVKDDVKVYAEEFIDHILNDYA